MNTIARKPLLFLLTTTLTAFFLPSCTYDSLSFQPDCEGVIVLETVAITPSGCDQAVGSIEVTTVDPNLVGIEYSIDGSDFQSAARFEALAAGSYTITARNADCESSLEVQVENAEGLNANANTNPADCGANTGSIEVIAQNASGNLSYSLNGGPTQSSAFFTGLAAGEYDLNVQDELGCEVNLSVEVRIDIEYATIEAFINTSCAVSGCHAGNVNPDFRVKDNVINNANAIRSRTTARSMPPSSSGLSLTDEEIEAIQCWVDNGAEG